MVELSLDFETRSLIDLRKTGVHVYAAHPSTDIWCMAFAFGDEKDVGLWTPGASASFARVFDHVRAGGAIRAWNAQFERLIWWHILGPRYGFPVPELEQFVCTAAEAAAMALPRGLGEAAAVLKVAAQKDDGGRRLMLQMSRPRKPTKAHPELRWWDEPEKLERLYEYCRQDVRAERAVGTRIRRLSAGELQVYLLDQRVNDRGIQLDHRLVVASQELVGEATARANRELKLRTKGEVSAVTKVGELTKWLEARGVCDNVRKDTLRDLLAEGDVTGVEKAVIELRVDAGKSSTAKLTTMLAVMGADARARGLTLYHGAGTGRWTGKLIQPQNFPRGSVGCASTCARESDKNAKCTCGGVVRFIPRVLAGDYEGIEAEEPVMVVVSSLLRSMLVASAGDRLMAADYSQIEARVLAWIAEQDDLVEAFATGAKVYERMAAAIYGVPVSTIQKDSVERQIGKVTILGAGYQMGASTFREQTKVQTGIDLSEEDAKRAIDTYRSVNGEIKSFWYRIERAAIEAVKKPGSVTSCGRRGSIRFTHRGEWLWCVLPSGRPLAYALPKLELRSVPWSDTEKRLSLTYATVSSKTRQWRRQGAYGGLLTENVVQAMARDLMAGAMLRLEAAGYPVVLTVHDEVLCGVPKEHGSLGDFVRLMKTRPRWAADLPVDADGWEGDRYRK